MVKNTLLNKHGFDTEEFDIPFLVKATDKKEIRGRDGYGVYCSEDGNTLPVYEYVPRTKGVVNPEFGKKHNLASSLKPHQIMDVLFMPLNKPRGKGLFTTEEATTVPDFLGDFQMLAIWTNLKVKLVGAGPCGSYYPDFKDFPTTDTPEFIYFYF